MVTVVFDGRAGIENKVRSSFVKVVFSMDETADDAIKGMVHRSKNRKNVIVVTNDRAVQYAVRAEGAQVIGVKAFLSQAKKGMMPARQKEGSRRLSHSEEYQITREMADIWLKRKKE